MSARAGSRTPWLASARRARSSLSSRVCMSRSCSPVGVTEGGGVKSWAHAGGLAEINKETSGSHLIADHPPGASGNTSSDDTVSGGRQQADWWLFVPSDRLLE